MNPPPSASSAPSAVSPSRPTAGARYLAVALAADREINRLRGLYLPEATKPHNDVHIILERREPTVENYPPGQYPNAPTNATPPDPARAGGLCGGTPLGPDASADSLVLPPSRAREGGQGVRFPTSPAESATSLASASAISAPSAVSPNVNMPRIWKRRPSSPYASHYPGTSGGSGVYVTYGDQR